MPAPTGTFSIPRHSNGALRSAPNNTTRARRFVNDAALSGDDQMSKRDDFIRFIEDNENHLHRSCVPGHITASSIVIDAARDKTVLLRHRKLERWLQPGGHADGDGNLGHVAWKEATEETGIPNLKLVTPALDLDIHLIPALGSDPSHLHFDVRFLLLAPPGSEIKSNQESTDADWFAKDHPVAQSRDVKRVVQRAFAVLADNGQLVSQAFPT